MITMTFGQFLVFTSGSLTAGTIIGAIVMHYANKKIKGE
jgi:hypothetical protein